MNKFFSLLFLSLFLAFTAGCGGPISKVDADKESESKWRIKKRSVFIGGNRYYDVHLKTKGEKFKATIETEYTLETRKFREKWDVIFDGSYVWVTNLEEASGDGPYKKSDYTTKWPLDLEFFRKELFWKTNFLAPDPTQDGEEKIDGKSYQKWVSQAGNAMGGTTEYIYYIDPSKHYMRKWTRQFVGDVHLDEYECLEFNGNADISSSEFKVDKEGKEVMKFDMFNEDL